MGAAVAIGVGGALAAVGSIASGAMQSSASKSAANAQLAGVKNANQLQWKMYQQNREDMTPWRTAGTTAINRMSAGVQPGGEYDKFTMKDFQADPGYAWRQQQGQDAVRAGSSAAGNFGSGNMGVALQNYGQNLASNEYASAYGRWLDQYNRVAGISQTGQQQSQAIAALGANTANVMGQNTMAGANAQAQGIIGSANAWGNAMGNMNTTMQSGMGTYMNYQNQQQLMGMLGGSGSMGNAWGSSGGSTDAGMYAASSYAYA